MSFGAAPTPSPEAHSPQPTSTKPHKPNASRRSGESCGNLMMNPLFLLSQGVLNQAPVLIPVPTIGWCGNQGAYTVYQLVRTQNGITGWKRG